MTSSLQKDTQIVKTTLRLRICVSCRREASRSELIRITFDYNKHQIVLHSGSPKDRAIIGRSAYLCRKVSCVEQALKGNRLRIALEGRRPKNTAPKRKVAWPLESQIIHTLRSRSTEVLETCQNTPTEEGNN